MSSCLTGVSVVDDGIGQFLGCGGTCPELCPCTTCHALVAVYHLSTAGNASQTVVS